MTDLHWIWVVAGVSLVIDLLASATKSAYTHVRIPHLLSMHTKDAAQVERTIALLEKPGIRTALRLGLVFSHIMLAGSVALALELQFPGLTVWHIMLILIGMTILISVFEFLAEKSILDHPETSALRWTGTATLIDFFFTPVTHLLMAILGKQAEKVTLNMTDEALRNWVEEGQPEGTLEKGEREMIYSIFRFGDTLAKDIMVPRMDLLALDIKTTIAEARKEFINAGHSRVPVYDGTIDNVIGLLYAKDLLSVVDGAETIESQRKLLRQTYFVPEVKKVDDLLTEMQSKGIHMALVVDEFGGVAGVVTLEDIVEEIVGEIRDEYDTGEEQLFTKNSDSEFVFLGRATIDEVNEITGLRLSDDHADTLGGYIYSRLGRVPQPGEIVEVEGAVFTVEEVVARRILKVKAELSNGIESYEETEEAIVD